MIVETRLNKETTENLKAYKKRIYNEEARISAGYLLGLASEKIDEVGDEDLLGALRVCEARKNDNTGGVVAISLRIEVYDRIVKFQKRLQGLSGIGTMNMEQVLDVLMHSVNRIGPRTGVLEIAERAIGLGIDTLVFKHCYEISNEQDKEVLLEAVRQYLERDPKGIVLCGLVKAQAAKKLKDYSDYYNRYRYTPIKRMTLGTVNIRYVSKTVAGVILCAAEKEDIEVSRIIEEIKQKLNYE